MPEKKSPKKPLIKEVKKCRISGEKLIPLFSLGKLYVSDFLPKDTTEIYDAVELKMCLAPKSGLIQLSHTTPADIMYRKYWYRSGTNMTMTKELQGIAETVQKFAHTKPGDVWVDIGCNDGTLFKFVDKEVIKIGFDPNNFRKESEKHAHKIINDYFNHAAFKKTTHGKKQKAKVVTSIAMFYDLEDPNEFVRDIYKTLDDDGLWVIQMSYLPLMLKQLAFDNICHEHIEYYTLTSLNFLLKGHGFKVVDCELNDVNGGSFRIYIQKNIAKVNSFASAPHRDVAEHRVASVFEYEKKLKLNSKTTYLDFQKKIEKLKKQTVDFIKAEKKKGKSIWGYGASTKGNTLLQWFDLDETLIDGIAERSPEKYGLKTIGSNIPIYSEAEMRKAKPDYLFILPWHFINEFKEREKEFIKNGGKLIVPCPNFEIISE